MSEMICTRCGEVNGGSRSKCMLCGSPTYSPEYTMDDLEEDISDIKCKLEQIENEDTIETMGKELETIKKDLQELEDGE